MNIARLATAIAMTGALCACTHVSDHKATNASFNFTGQVKRIVLVNPDVTLGELTAGGVVETRADWTASAKGFIVDDVTAAMSAKGIETIKVEKFASEHEEQLAKLHDAVGGEAILHSYLMPLPSKHDAFDWTLGPGTNEMRDRYHADYALFIYVHDTYTTAGRALMMLGMAAIGVAVPGGQQIGFVSLVDLRTGNIVWFNMMNSTVGDLRDAKSAEPVVASLLEGIPL